MRSTATYDVGEVVVVNVPFSDRSGVKPRPAMIASVNGFHRKLPDLIVCPISSQPRYFNNPGPGDCPLTDWLSVGLRYPSTVRISKILAVDKKIIKRKLGRVAPHEIRRIQSGFRRALGL